VGPLQGVRVVEFEGIGPGPMCGMLLADLGAEVMVIERVGGNLAAELGMKGVPAYFLDRGKSSLLIDLKHPRGAELALRVIAGADALIEGFRPGTMERLGLGPDVCLARNRRLVYGRMTGWGQSGPLAQAAGHDLNYVALVGALDLAPRPRGKPAVPPTVMGDAGGAVFLAFGIVCGILEARRSGHGQVVDQAMVDAASTLTAIFRATAATGALSNAAGASFFHDSDFYDVYECSDGRHIAIAALERKFYVLLTDKLGLDCGDPATQYDPAFWPARKARLAEIIRGKSRDQWCTILEGSDVCFAPVLSLDEAPRHPHAVAREAFLDVAGTTQPAPTPRFSRTAPTAAGPPPARGQGADHILRRLGLSLAEIVDLRAAGVLR